MVRSVVDGPMRWLATRGTAIPRSGPDVGEVGSRRRSRYGIGPAAGAVGSGAKYRRRNAVERCVGWLTESHRIATRYVKLAIHYLAMLELAMIQRCLRLLYPSNRI